MSACAKFEFPSLSRSGLKVSGSGGVGWGGFQVTTVSNLNPSCIELESGLGFDNDRNPSCIEVEFGLGFDNATVFDGDLVVVIFGGLLTDRNLIATC